MSAARQPMMLPSEVPGGRRALSPDGVASRSPFSGASVVVAESPWHCVLAVELGPVLDAGALAGRRCWRPESLLLVEPRLWVLWLVSAVGDFDGAGFVLLVLDEPGLLDVGPAFLDVGPVLVDRDQVVLEGDVCVEDSGSFSLAGSVAISPLPRRSAAASRAGSERKPHPDDLK